MLQVALVSTNKASRNLSTLVFNVKPVLNRNTEDNIWVHWSRDTDFGKL